MVVAGAPMLRMAGLYLRLPRWDGAYLRKELTAYVPSRPYLNGSWWRDGSCAGSGARKI